MTGEEVFSGEKTIRLCTVENRLYNSLMVCKREKNQKLLLVKKIYELLSTIKNFNII